MGSCPAAIQDYWGYLIEPDNTPSPRLEELLLGIARYISKQVAPWQVRCLSPVKLAAFYKLVGGNYDVVFLETSHSGLAYIYRALGCYHTLQPVQNPFASPSIPALTPEGFVRWQTIQILLGPNEHVAFLQEALKTLEIKDPTDGKPFPKILPRTAFPAEPDSDMTKWHDMTLGRLQTEEKGQRAIEREGSRALEEDDGASYSSTEEKSTTDVADLVKVRPKLPPLRPDSFSGAKTVSPIVRRSADLPQERSPSHDHHHHRRRSLPHNDAQWHNDDVTPTERSHRRRSSSPRARTLSITSGSETTNDAFTGSEASLSPKSARYRELHEQSPRPFYDSYGRRHSAHSPYNEVDHIPKPQSRKHQTLSPQFFRAHGVDSRPPSVVYQEIPSAREHQQHSPPRGLSGPQVQFRDSKRSYGAPSSVTNRPASRPSFNFSERDSNYFNDRPRRQQTDYAMATGGRRYPAETSAWR
ncbi:hypothetical protein MMC11_006356 [Xylographa trunciseda]|nr:hypothetical protein [Xylographa trunciseda]